MKKLLFVFSIVSVVVACSKKFESNLPQHERNLEIYKVDTPYVNAKIIDTPYKSSKVIDTLYLSGRIVDTLYIGSKVIDTPYINGKVIDTPYLGK